jgi:hypothetical protein
MPIGHEPSSRARNWSKKDWGRYWHFRRRLDVRRHAFRAMFEEHGDLYGHQWELAEATLILEECAEIGLPMGYGRVGRPPVQLTWGIATPPNPRVDWGTVEE